MLVFRQMQRVWYRKGVWSAGWALAMLPGPALAATASAATDGYFVALAAVAVLAAGGGLFALYRGRSAAARATAAEAASDRLGAILDAMPEGSYYWIGNARGGRCSKAFAALLGHATPSALRLGDFAPHLAAVNFAALERAVASGGTFTLDLVIGDGQRVLRAVGSAVEDAGAEAGTVALWMSDLSDHARDLARLVDAGAAARDSHLGVARLMDAIPFPIWRRGADLNISFCNDAYAKWVETEPAKVRAEGIELISGIDPDQAAALARLAWQSDTPQREARHLVVDGERRLVEITERRIPGTDEIAGFARDVTDIEMAENDLARHVLSNDEVLETLRSAIAVYGADKHLHFFNASFVRLWRLDEDWLETEPSYGDVLEALRDRRRLPEQADFVAFKKQQMALFTSLTEPMEELLHLPDETTLRVVIAPHPMGGILFVQEDVTDRLALERSYNTLIAVQRATLDNLQEGVCVLGGDGRIKLSNTNFQRIWNFDAAFIRNEPHIGEVLEGSKDLFLFDDDWESFKVATVEWVMDRVPHSRRFERADAVAIVVSSIPLPDGATLVTFLDVTDSNRIERALRERTEALEAADRLKSEFVANVSYELRTPLNTIMGFTEILHNKYFGELNDRQTEYCSAIIESSQQLLALINNILDLSVVESGQMTLAIDEVNIHEALADVVQINQERMRRNSLKMVFDCPPEIGMFDADERRLKQIVFNLLSNAIKFTPADGVITLGVRRGDAGLDIWVSDTGVGIPAEEQRRVFEKFQRSRTARNSGTGLGLSLVKSFVELHGGKVTIESKPDSGTRVDCHFPARPATTDAAERKRA